MTSTLRTAAFVFAMAPLAAFAQGQPVTNIEDTRAPISPFGQATCTQLERQLGLSGAECGTMTNSELSEMKADKED